MIRYLHTTKLSSVEITLCGISIFFRPQGKLVPCLECPEVFEKKIQLSSHYKFVHPDATFPHMRTKSLPKYECKGCNKKFVTKVPTYQLVFTFHLDMNRKLLTVLYSDRLPQSEQVINSPWKYPCLQKIFLFGGGQKKGPVPSPQGWYPAPLA